MCLMGVHLMGMHPCGRVLRRTPHGRVSHAVYLMGMYLTGVHLMGMYLPGVHLMGMYLTGMHLTGVHLINVHPTDVHLIGVYVIGGSGQRNAGVGEVKGLGKKIGGVLASTVSYFSTL
jgi:hypothetical protein